MSFNASTAPACSMLSSAILIAALAGSAKAAPVVHNLGVMPGGGFSTRGVVSADGTTVTVDYDLSHDALTFEAE